MKYLVLAIITLALGAPSHIASAQSNQAAQERIVVTGSRITRALDRPSIAKRIRADFILVDVVYQSGTRDASERRRELETMFNRLKEADSKNPNVFLQGGSAYGRIPIETILFSDILDEYELDDGYTFSLTLGIETGQTGTFDAVLARGQAFIDAIPLAGRAEAYLKEDQYIGARNSDAHRADLLRLIAAEVEDLKSVFGSSEVTVTGLENRVISQPAAALGIDVFLPYTITVKALSN